MLWRWALTGVIVVVAAAVALWPRIGSETDGPATARQSVERIDTGLRAASGVAKCPRPAASAAGAGPLSGLPLRCLADGAPVDAAAALTGRPAVLNLWAYWCEPCRTELPILQEYANRAGPAVAVLTVHSDPDEAKALRLLAALNHELRGRGRPELRLPGLQDAEATVRTAAGAPTALPITVLVRPDGSIADYVARPFRDIDDIADTVAETLGATV